MNIRLEKRDDQKQYQCDQCDFRADNTQLITQHKRRDHSGYMVLCDQCGYMSNQLGHLKRHVIAKHPEDFTAKHIHM